MEFCRLTLAAEPVGFGSAILRFDTAALAAAVITQDRRRAG
jgi:16S rRNA U1498 N3-methylase RsmE